ncbi:DNA-directed RNA polymerase subunit L [uncultured archaeon]|nr:DNA-directed RNA polymerase subunit L [uncultured archaeon]
MFVAGDSMEIEVIKNEKDYLEIAIKGEEYGMVNMLKELLLEDGKVEFAAFRMDHPQAASPVLMVRTSEGSPLFALRSAIKKLRKQATDFRDAIKEAKKPKK